MHGLVPFVTFCESSLLENGDHNTEPALMISEGHCGIWVSCCFFWAIVISFFSSLFEAGDICILGLGEPGEMIRQLDGDPNQTN